LVGDGDAELREMVAEAVAELGLQE
jgi:hypothetical protein